MTASPIPPALAAGTECTDLLCAQAGSTGRATARGSHRPQSSVFVTDTTADTTWTMVSNQQITCLTSEKAAAPSDDLFDLPQGAE